MTDAEHVVEAVTAATLDACGPRLRGLYLHGSLVAGDFDPGRSDLDLLAVLDRDPDEALLDRLRPAYAAVERAHPTWAGRLEVELVSTAALDAGAGQDAGLRGHVIARVSPGEELHLLAASTHRVLTWASVHEKGRALAGPPAVDLLPPVDPGLVRAALLEHVRDWPTWVRDMHGTGGQAYAVLTTCRALVRLREGVQLSKRAAAERATRGLAPEDADLVRWACDWWYGGGADDAPPRTAEVVAFVDRASARMREDEARPPSG